MYQDYELEPAVWNEKPLSFSWDPETGDLQGRDADRVRELAIHYQKQGEINSHPHPTTYDILDPLHTPSEMAVILGHFWRLPSELAAHLPRRK